MKKITRGLVLQYLHPEPASQYKYLQFQLMPIFYIWGVSYLQIDSRYNNHFQKLLKSEEMKQLLPFIFRFRKGLDPKALFPTLTLLRYLSKPESTVQDFEMTKRELTAYIKSEVPKVKLWSMKRWSKHNKISYSRMLLCLCIGAAGFKASRGERIPSDEYVTVLYREANKEPVNFQKVFHFIANGINRDEWWNQVSNYEIGIVTSLHNKYLHLIARETFMHPEQIASMFIGGTQTRPSPVELQKICEKKRTNSIRSDWITQFLQIE